MKAGWTISAVGHAALLAWGLISIAAKPLNATPPESLPVDIISDTDFSQITNGIKTAAKAETPKPLVEKIAEAKPVEEANAKVVNNTLIRPRPMPPGPTQYIFAYHVAVTDGKATLSFTSICTLNIRCWMAPSG